MPRLKSLHYRLSDETIHQLVEIARINELLDQQGEPNRSEAIRFSAARAAKALKVPPYDPSKPIPSKTPAKGSRSSRTHCIHGHEYPEGKVTRDSRGHVCCLECNRLRAENNRAVSAKLKKPRKKPKDSS